jgi:transketolase
MQGFGESGPYQDLYRHFGITAVAAVDAVKARL